MVDVVEILKALADETRVRIINLLRFGPLCVCEIEDIMKVNQSNASRHLIKLKGADVIIAQKQAQWVYYSLNEQLLADHPFVRNLLEQELHENADYCRDVDRLKMFKEQGGDCEHKINLDG